MVYVFLADGFEEVEALTPVDIMRRAGIACRTVGVTGKTVTGAHGINVQSDIEINGVDFSDAQMLVLPGGMPGAENLEKSADVKRAVLLTVQNGKKVAAICAAPYVLGVWGLLGGKNATCYPGFEDRLLNANYTAAAVETDGNIITANGPAAAMDFAFEIIKQLGSDKSEKIRLSMQFREENHG